MAHLCAIERRQESVGKARAHNAKRVWSELCVYITISFLCNIWVFARNARASVHLIFS